MGKPGRWAHQRLLRRYQTPSWIGSSNHPHNTPTTKKWYNPRWLPVEGWVISPSQRYTPPMTWCTTSKAGQNTYRLGTFILCWKKRKWVVIKRLLRTTEEKFQTDCKIYIETLPKKKRVKSHLIRQQGIPTIQPRPLTSLIVQYCWH